MENKREKDIEKLNKNLLAFIESFNFTQGELDQMTLEEFINHVYNRNVF
jgi:hypothetical protein